ncbi:hypothetical protein AgCh_032274 [Apium graveolens]
MDNLRVKRKGGRLRKVRKFSFFDYSVKKQKLKKVSRPRKQNRRKNSQDFQGMFLNNSEDLAKEVYEVEMQLGLSFSEDESEAIKQISNRIQK